MFTLMRVDNALVEKLRNGLHQGQEWKGQEHEFMEKDQKVGIKRGVEHRSFSSFG
jgi:hypothetical protein